MTTEITGDGVIKFNGTDVITLSTSGPSNASGKLSSGLVRLGSVEWTTNTGFYDFNVVDGTKYINYMLYWFISHQNSTNSGNQWNVTSLVFLTSGGEVTQYDNNTMWASSSNTTESVNSEALYRGIQSQIWMAGNGTAYDSHGECLITIPNSANFRACVRGKSQLLGTPRQGTTNVNFREDFASVAYNQNPTLITGIRIRGWSGTGFTSQYGSVQLYGIEK